MNFNGPLVKWYHASFAPRSHEFESRRVHQKAVVAYALYKQLVEVSGCQKAVPVIPKFSTAEMRAPCFALPSVLNEEKR